MIVVDTSALMAILLGEPEAEACMDAIARAEKLAISAGTAAEALIVAQRRNVEEEMSALISGLGFEVVPVTASFARDVACAYGRWGKGAHAAGLNFGDCFAFALAKDLDLPLLFVGDDFTKSDVARAI